jgi:hypothetical protein
MFCKIGLWALQALLAALFLWHGQFMVLPHNWRHWLKGLAWRSTRAH